MNNRVLRIVCTIFYSLMLASCAAKQPTLEEEVEAFCQIHEKEHWQSVRGETAENGFKLIAAETRRVIKSEAFLSVFEKLAKKGYDDYYQALQVEISEMLGEPWHCESAEQFYTIEWKLVGVDREGPEVVAQVLESGAMVIGGTEYAAEDVKGIEQALEAEAGGQTYQLLLRIPDGISDDELPRLVAPFVEVGVDQFTVLDN